MKLRLGIVLKVTGISWEFGDNMSGIQFGMIGDMRSDGVWDYDWSDCREKEE